MLMRCSLIFVLLATWAHCQSTEEAATTEGGDDGGGGEGSGEGSGDGSGDGGTTEAEETTTIATTQKATTKITTRRTTKKTTSKTSTTTTPNKEQTSTMKPSWTTVNGSSLPQLPNQPQATETPQQVGNQTGVPHFRIVSMTSN